MTSHEYADSLVHLAAALRSRPEFTVSDHMRTQWLSYFADKEGFLAAARALGSGRKDVDKDYFSFYPACTDGCLRVYINREAVCRKVQDEKWECEPLLSEDEVAAVGG